MLNERTTSFSFGSFRQLFQIILLALITGCGGGSSGSDDESENTDNTGFLIIDDPAVEDPDLEDPVDDIPNVPEDYIDPNAKASSLVGNLPSSVTSYSLTLNNEDVLNTPVSDLPTSQTQPVLAFTEDDQLLYWGSGKTLSVTGHLADAKSTAIMIIYSFLMPYEGDSETETSILNAIDQHAEIDQLSQAIEAIVQYKGFFDFEALTTEDAELAARILSDVSTTLQSIATVSAKSIEYDEARVYPRKVGAVPYSDGTEEPLKVSFLGFSQPEEHSDIEVNLKMNNAGRLFYDTYLIYDEQEIMTEPLAGVLPAKEFTYTDFAKSVSAFLGIGSDPFAITDISRSTNSDITISVPVEWSFEGSGGFLLVADPVGTSYGKLINLLNIMGPIITYVTGVKWDVSKLASSSTDLALNLAQVASARENDLNGLLNGVDVKLAYEIAVYAISSVYVDNATVASSKNWGRLVRVGAGLFNFASQVKTTVNAYELIEALTERERKFFEIRPIPIEITAISADSDQRYDLTFKVWGNDNAPLLGDENTSINLYIHESNDSSSLIEDIVYSYPDQAIPPYLYYGSLVKSIDLTNYDGESITTALPIDIEPPFWVMLLPGADNVCDNCNNVFPSRPYNDPPIHQQGQYDRPLFALGKNLAFVGAAYCQVPEEVLEEFPGIEDQFSYGYNNFGQWPIAQSKEGRQFEKLFDRLPHPMWDDYGPSEKAGESAMPDLKTYLSSELRTDVYDIDAGPAQHKLTITCDSDKSRPYPLEVDILNSEKQFNLSRRHWTENKALITIPYDRGTQKGPITAHYPSDDNLSDPKLWVTFEMENDYTTGDAYGYLPSGITFFEQRRDEKGCLEFSQFWMLEKPEWTEEVKHWDCSQIDEFGNGLRINTWIDNHNGFGKDGVIYGRKITESDYIDGVLRESRHYTGLGPGNNYFYNDYVWRHYFYNENGVPINYFRIDKDGCYEWEMVYNTSIEDFEKGRDFQDQECYRPPS